MIEKRLLWNRRQFVAVLLSGLAIGFSASSAITSPPKAASAEDAPNLVQANNALAISMLREVDTTDASKNQFLSPFSIQSALAIALEGARNETAAEMGLALGYPPVVRSEAELPWDMARMRQEFSNVGDRLRPDDSAKANQLRAELVKLRTQLSSANAAATEYSRNNKYKEANEKFAEASKLADRINQLATQVDQYELQNANSLWVEKSFALSKDYQSRVTRYYRATANNCDFRSNSAGERLRINKWVNEQTREKIRDIVPPKAINEMTRLVIANAIYFKGTWSQPFDPNFTKSAPFNLRNQQTVQVSLMSKNGFEGGKYAAFNADGTRFDTPKMVDESVDVRNGYPTNGFQVAELPYNGDAISMLVFVPSNPEGLTEMLDSLSAARMQTCAEQLESREIHLGLPKFKLETNYNLIDPLKNLGMKRAFSESEADFSGLTDIRTPDHSLYISAIIHKAFVDVNEKGTEAAAATVVLFAPASAAVEKRPFVPIFRADRPFLFAIREKSSGLILFIGKVEKPDAI